MRANLVGRSVVSAMIQTPTSGWPLGARTTPPMSSLSMAGVAAAALCACAELGNAVTAAPDTTTMAIAATLEHRMSLSFIATSSDPDTLRNVRRNVPAYCGLAQIRRCRRYRAGIGAGPERRDQPPTRV